MKRNSIILLLVAVVMLKLTGCSEEQDVYPLLEAIAAEESEVTATTAILKGEITRLGNMNIREYGIELSKSMIFSPSQSGGYTSTAVQGVFQVEFTALDPNTVYYYKAYAVVNTARIYSTGYLTFKTLVQLK